MSRTIKTEVKKLKQGVVKTLKEKLFYVTPGIKDISVETLDKTSIITVRYEGDLSDEEILKKIVSATKQFARGFMEVEKEILHDRRHVKPKYSNPIFEEMLEKGWIHEYETGRVALDKEAQKLFEFFDAEFVKIADDYNAEHIKFPVLISTETLRKADYFASFPHHITLASHLVEDLDGIKEFSDLYSSGNREVDFSKVKTETKHVASPAVCFHLYQALEGKKLDGIIRKTAIGPSFRYESGNLNTLERLWDFSMREIIFVGPVDKVDELRLSAMKPVMELVDKLKLKSHIETASDPFFVGNYAGQTFYQLSRKTKYELRLYLPFKGENESLAAASFNWHQKFFGGNFNISVDPEGTSAGTACVAFGVERWIYAFLSQYSLNRDLWPEYINDNI